MGAGRWRVLGKENIREEGDQGAEGTDHKMGLNGLPKRQGSRLGTLIMPLRENNKNCWTEYWKISL